MNAGAGSIGAVRCEDTASAIAQAFRAAGVEIRLVQCEPTDLVRAAREAAGYPVDAVVAAGGDGTCSAIASGLVGTGMPMAVLPLGTLNHFARDLGMPTELTAAARAIATGHDAAIDVAEVNGRVFINNSSIGLYAEAVTERDRDQRRTGHSKWRAMAHAAWRVMRAFPLLKLTIEVAHRTYRGRMPLVFVGNNEYTVGPRQLGTRAQLDGGQLAVYVATSRSPLKLLWMTLRAIVGQISAVRDFQVHMDTATRIDVHHRSVRVAVDGEVVVMRSPLHYRMRAGALRVIRPVRAAAEAA